MNQVVEMPPDAAAKKRAYKIEWQRRQRRAFRDAEGYSTSANYGAGGNRKAVLERDGYACVRCGMTDAAHKSTWNRPITIDHKSKDRSDNSMANLQTLCLKCHGNKDLIARLRVARAPQYKEQMLSMRAAGHSFKSIGIAVGLSIGAVHKWIKQWEQESK